MYLNELDAINEMFATIGEAPLNTLDDDHDMVAAARRILRVASHREQSKSWWFNQERVTLQPDEQGNVRVPNDTLRIDPEDPTVRVAQRGGRLYDLNRGSFTFANGFRCILIRYVAFEDLPAPAQTVVSYAAQLDFQKAYDADVQKFQQLNVEYGRALNTLSAEHIRNRGANLLRRPYVMGNYNEIAPSNSPGLPVAGTYRLEPVQAEPTPSGEFNVPVPDFAQRFKDQVN